MITNTHQKEKIIDMEAGLYLIIVLVAPFAWYWYETNKDEKQTIIGMSIWRL